MSLKLGQLIIFKEKFTGSSEIIWDNVNRKQFVSGKAAIEVSQHVFPLIF